MKLIECRNQNEIIQALLIRKEKEIDPILDSDLNSVIFLIQKTHDIIGMLTLTFDDNSSTINEINLVNETHYDLLKTIELIENYCIEKQVHNLCATTNIEKSNIFKQLGFHTSNEMYIKNNNLVLDLKKGLKLT